MSGKICPQCGTEFELDQRFCPKDGSTLKTVGASDLVGETIADRYYVLRKLGEGGMGQVYLAEHVKMQRKSAVKVMNPSMVHDADAIQRFNREAANASKINHPNVAAIYDFGETKDGMIYLAMEFIEGEPLTKLIERTGALPPGRAASIAAQTAGALAAAHDMGIVHRDLKPDNIMIGRARDGSDVVKVVDFGIAKATEGDKQKVTKTGLVVGTPEYMSPEQLAGDKLDGRSDTYSLGLVTFNMLTGKLPFPSETVQESMIMRLTDRPRTLTEMTGQSHWPAELQVVLDKALARELDERYRSAGDFGRELTRAVEGMPETALAGAGTLVMSAPGVPATRVAGGGASAQTVALDTAAPPPAAPSSPRIEEKRSRVPLMVGGGVAVAAIVGVFAMTQLKDGGAVTPPTDSVAAAGDDTGTTQLSSRLPDATPVRPDTAGRRVTTPSTSSPRPVESSTTGPASTAYNPEADFNRWLSEAQDTSNVPRARRVITQVDRVVPRLATAMDSAIARYIQAQAWATYAISTEDVAEQRLRYNNVCRILRTDSATIVQTPYSRQARDLLELCP